MYCIYIYVLYIYNIIYIYICTVYTHTYQKKIRVIRYPSSTSDIWIHNVLNNQKDWQDRTATNNEI